MIEHRRRFHAENSSRRRVLIVPFIHLCWINIDVYRILEISQRKCTHGMYSLRVCSRAYPSFETQVCNRYGRTCFGKDALLNEIPPFAKNRVERDQKHRQEICTVTSKYERQVATTSARRVRKEWKKKKKRKRRLNRAAQRFLSI